ncbi:hypothetical protein BDV10DRAFT_190061 [Aspergillus recurvatus]
MDEQEVSRWGRTVQVLKQYGPAECSVIATIQCLSKRGGEPNNIGYATGCVCWVVDREDHERERLVPIGAVGELLIEGPIVGRGYLNDPERTAAAFIDPPAWLHEFRLRHINDTCDGSRGRLYKTGDLVQYAADGSLRFVGRKDTQVKLRGQRIELGEVEHHTRRSFQGARDVVAEVVTPAEAERPPLLVAFVWTDDSSNNNPGDPESILAAPTDAFRAAIPAADAALHDVVPAYMVPALFLTIVAVPLTTTGKTDRRRLRDRAAALSRAEIDAYHGPAAAKRAPATATERTLQQLWAKVLNLPPDTIGADDSFFRLGGDSIAAMRLAGAAREDSLTLTVADVFKFPGLAQLATVILSTASQTTLPAAPPPFSLLSVAETELFLRKIIDPYIPLHDHEILDAFPTTEFTADCVNSHQCTYFLLHIEGLLDPRRLTAACEALLLKYPILRSSYFPSSRGIIQVVFRDIDFEMTRFESAQDLLQLAKYLCRQDADTPLPFGSTPFQVSLASQGDQQHVLIIRLSHAQYDRVSLPTLYRDLAAAYRGD